MNRKWPTKTLGEVCQFRGGGTPSKSVERYWCGDIPWVSPKDMKFDVVSDSIDHISQEAIHGSATSLIPKDSVLMVVRSGILARIVPIAITGRDLAINQDLKALCPHKVMSSRFLYHLLDSKMDELLSMVTRGATVHRLMTDQIRNIDFTLPPLAEQYRIVTILDEAFAGLATAKANAERNLQNARALFESHLQSVFTLRGEGWEEKRLDELCTFSSGGTPSKSNSSYWRGEIPWVSGRDMKSTRLSDSALHISQEAVDESATRIASAGTLLILVRGMGLAHGAQIAELLVPCAFNQDIRGIQAKPSLLPRFLLFALRNRINLSDTVLSNAAHGTLKIDSEKLQKVVIAFPRLEQQRKIVAVIDTLASEINRLESIYQRKLAALDDLKKFFLHQAFTGQL